MLIFTIYLMRIYKIKFYLDLIVNFQKCFTHKFKLISIKHWIVKDQLKALDNHINILYLMKPNKINLCKFPSPDPIQKI